MHITSFLYVKYVTEPQSGMKKSFEVFLIGIL